jgi:NAD(P)-dependent dehydrogenase (short-subunit alcohol dehydrogenase family)
VGVMTRQGAGGRIVNISSISGKRGNSYFGAYTFAKFGMIGFTQTLACEVPRLGITVNAVCPGTVETDMIDQVGADRDTHGRPECRRGPTRSHSAVWRRRRTSRRWWRFWLRLKRATSPARRSTWMGAG